jgi:hypothetical protein
MTQMTTCDLHNATILRLERELAAVKAEMKMHEDVQAGFFKVAMNRALKAESELDHARIEQDHLQDTLKAVKAERDGLRKHADTMFNWITGDGDYCSHEDCETCTIAKAYRADFPAPDTPKE